MRTHTIVALGRAATFALTLAVAPSSAGAQTTSQTAADQIREVHQAMRSLASPAAAKAAGFEPVLGWIPTMGVHWVNPVRMQAGRTFKLGEPAQLMFSPIGGWLPCWCLNVERGCSVSWTR